MIKALLLDTSPLSLATARPGKPEADDCRRWIKHCRGKGVVVYVPEIADYEVRREMVRAGKTNSIRRLDAMALTAVYLPITTEAMRLAADLWAEIRNAGLPTADVHALDGDVILCAQARLLAGSLHLAAEEVMVATNNPAHIRRFVTADHWRNIIL